MKCLYFCLVTVTVISAAVPEDICETCVPTQDCPLFENLSYEDQLLWMEKFPCGPLKNNNFNVPAGFASAAKGDYVCCSNNIWGIEKPEHDPQIGHQSWHNNNPTHSSIGDYSNSDDYNRNNFNTVDDNPIQFPDSDNYYNNEINNKKPGSSNNYSDRNNNTNRPTDNNNNFPNNNSITNHLLDDNNVPNTSETNDYEVTNANGTVWFPNRTHNYYNTDYWLTHDPGNTSNNRPGNDWNIRTTERSHVTNIPINNTPRPNPVSFSPGNTPRPFYRDPNNHRPGNPPPPVHRYPYNNIPVYNPNIMPPNRLYPREIVRPPNQFGPPNNFHRPPVMFNPPDIYLPKQYIPRENPRLPPPRQPYINYPQWPHYNNNQGRPYNNYENNGPYDTRPPFNDRDEGNFGSGQCARLTSFPPDPQSDCCGRQLADSDRITGRPPQYNKPAYTNHWNRPYDYDYAPVWNTRDEVAVNGTDEEVTIERRISGGQATELYQYPWLVLLLTTFDYGRKEAAFNCGGSLISSKYVLTAGHCVYDKGAAVKSVQVNLAEYDKRTFPKDCKVTRNGRQCIENVVMYAEHIITHPQYQNENLLNDIALIRLQGTAPYTGYIRPICLPTINIDEPQFSNLQFEVAGWGRNGPYSSEIKQSTFLHLTNHNQCKRYYPQLTDKHLCAAGQRGADTCKGDSGGPLMILYRGRYFVTGIVSGKRADSPCGTAVPSLYTNVYHYVDWIRRNIKN